MQINLVAFRSPGHFLRLSGFRCTLFFFPVLSLGVVVGVLALIISNHSLRGKKNQREPGEDAPSQSHDNDFDD